MQMFDQGFCAISEVGGANQLLPFMMNRFGSTIDVAVDYSSTIDVSVMGLHSINTKQAIENIELKVYKDIYLAPSHQSLRTQTIPFLAAAANTNTRTIALIDSWVNYRTRFEKILPNQILVTDEFALNHAKSTFKDSVELNLIKNYYLENLRYDVSDFPENVTLLFTTRKNNYTEDTLEIHGSGCICGSFKQIKKLWPDTRIVLRPHPQEPINDCLRVVNYSKCDYGTTISTNENLSQILSKSIRVIGPPSYLLYIAQQLGREVFQVGNVNRNWYGPVFKVMPA